jgi:hypothetical protein
MCTMKGHTNKIGKARLLQYCLYTCKSKGSTFVNALVGGSDYSVCNNYNKYMLHLQLQEL